MITLADQIQIVLRGCSHVRGYELSVMELEDSVVIGGIVNSYHHKQMAQECIRLHFEDKGLSIKLLNEIRVKYPLLEDSK